MATVRSEETAYLWTTPIGDLTRLRQLTGGFEKLDGGDNRTGNGLSWLSNDKIVYDSTSSGEHSIWTVEPDGDNPQQLVKNASGSTVSPDGRYVVYQGSGNDLWKKNISDGEEKQIAGGISAYPTFSPDGEWIVYCRWENNSVSIYKVPSAGGENVLIADKFNGTPFPAVAPNGKTIAIVVHRNKQARIGLMAFDGGELIKIFDAPMQSIPLGTWKMQWTPDGRDIYFLALNDNVSNIWRQPIDGSAPVQITHFKEGKISNFAFSPDGKQLALSRGTFNSDVVLIENAK